MIRWTDEGGGLGVCFSSALKSPCVSGPGGGQKIAPVPLEESLHKVTSLPWAFMREKSVSILSLSPPHSPLFFFAVFPLFSPSVT